MAFRSARFFDCFFMFHRKSRDRLLHHQAARRNIAAWVHNRKIPVADDEKAQPSKVAIRAFSLCGAVLDGSINIPPLED